MKSPSLRPSVCIDAVLANLPADTALGLVRDAGLTGFEFWGWWDRDLAELTRLKEKHGLAISACCTRFISLVDPDQRPAYLQGLQESIAAAQQLGCSTLISQVGDALPQTPRAEQTQSLTDGLRAAADLLDGTGITLVIEPLNELVDHAGYFLIRSSEAFDIVRTVNHPAIKVVFDIYHQQISEGHVIHNLTQNIDQIAHFHAAGNPGRNELTRGELHYPSIFDAIRSTPYQGYVGLEYWPLKDPLEGLKTVASWFESPETNGHGLS